MFTEAGYQETHNILCRKISKHKTSAFQADLLYFTNEMPTVLRAKCVIVGKVLKKMKMMIILVRLVQQMVVKDRLQSKRPQVQFSNVPNHHQSIFTSCSTLSRMLYAHHDRFILLNLTLYVPPTIFQFIYLG